MKLTWFVLVSFAALYMNLTYTKILIITHSYNRPDFIETQDATFKKFLKEPYRYVVFNDSRDEKICKEIERICKKLELECIRIPQDIHDKPYLARNGEPHQTPSVRTAEAIQYSLDTLGFDHDDIVMIIDSDMFLVRDFVISDYMDGIDLAAVPQRRSHVQYIWNGIVFLNMKTMPNKRSFNFNCGWVDGVVTDTGGHTYYYLRAQPTLRFKPVKQYCIYDATLACETCQQAAALNGDSSCVHQDARHYTELDLIKNHFDKKSRDFLLKHPPYPFEFFVEGGIFFHYRAGGNWNNQSSDYHARKTQFITNYMDDVLGKSSLIHEEL